MPQRPMQRGYPNRTDRTVGSRRAESAPVAFRLRRASACSDGGRRPKASPVAARARHCPLSEIVVSAVDDSLGRAAGYAVPALAGRGRLERATRCARFVHGRGKTGGAIPRGEFAPSDPCRPDNPGASGATHLSSNRIPYSPRTRAQREYERSTFSGSRKPSSDGQGRRCVGSRTAGVVQRAGPPRGNPLIKIRWRLGVDRRS